MDRSEGSIGVKEELNLLPVDHRWGTAANAKVKVFS